MYWNLTDKQRFTTAFILANKPALIQDFLSDILTEKEIDLCSNRLKAMCLLHDGASYKEIENITGLSSATISRLSKIVNSKNSGFNKIIKRFKEFGEPYFD